MSSARDRRPGPSLTRSARWYFRVTLIRRSAHRLGDAVCTGVFLGLMDRDALADVDATFYRTAAEPVDGRLATYEDPAQITSGLHDWEAAAVERHFPGTGRVLVTAAGGGREVLALLRAGYDAVGYEPNPRLVAAGQRTLRQLGHERRVHPSPRDVFPSQTGGADAVVLGWSSYMLIPGRARRTALLRAAREVLPSGAPVLVSFHVRAPDRTLRIVHRISRAVRRMRRAETTELGDHLEPNFIHFFTEQGLREELAEAGLECVSFAAAPYGHAVARVRA